MHFSSNNTNKLSPQELKRAERNSEFVQIIQINLVLKNKLYAILLMCSVQIIQINLVLKNMDNDFKVLNPVQIIQINLVLKNVFTLIQFFCVFK